MKIKHKTFKNIAFSSELVVLGIIAISQYNQKTDDAPVGDYDVYLEGKREWKDMEKAFNDGDLVVLQDNGFAENKK